MESHFLDLHLTVTGGVYGAPGKLQLFCWLNAVRLPGAPSHSTLVTVYPTPQGELAVTESTLSKRDVATLLRLLVNLGFPARPLKVKRVFDTSDVWQHVVLRAILNDDADTLELGLCCSGFEGQDADGLRGAFQRLLSIAGPLGHGDWYNLTGRL